MLEGILVAAGAGVIGAGISGLFSFVIVGLFVIVAVGTMTLGNVGGIFAGQIAFGVFGPAAAGFVGGCGAVAYAASRGKHPTGRDIGTPMAGLGDPGTLIVGAIFGAVGYALLQLINSIKLPAVTGPLGGTLGWTDTVALVVVIMALVQRLLFGKTGIFGKVPAGMSQMGMPDDAHAWLPWMKTSGQIAVLGLGGGLFGAWLCKVVGPGAGGNILPFGFSAFTLILLIFGIKVPVTHHMTLIGAQAFLASGSLIYGMIMGCISAFLGEYMSRLFLIYGDTHTDPPALAIFVMTTVVWAIGLAVGPIGLP